MKKQLVLTACLAFLLLFSSVSFGQMMGPGGGMGNGGGYGGAMWNNNYQPTPEQQKACQLIMEKYQPEFTKMTDSLWAKKAQLNAILAQKKVDSKQARTIAKEVGELMAKSYEVKVQMIIEMREKGLSYFGMGMMSGCMMDGGMMMGGGPRYQHRGQMMNGNRGMMQ